MGLSMSGKQLREDIAFVNRCILGQQEAAPVMEKEGEMRPHLDKATRLLDQAIDALDEAMAAATDNEVSSGELKLQRIIKARIETLYNKYVANKDF